MEYFDRREQKTKPIPQCWRAGLIWDEETQRCERFEPLGLMAGSDEWRGMGFLPGDDGGDGDIGGLIVGAIGAIGSFFSGLFGGDDQDTSYRPPSDSGDRFVTFDDKYGKESVAYLVNAASLAEAARRGNRADDIYSYYSAFVSGNTRSGASEAARRVIEDAARTNGVSIARAADLILNTAGITRIVQSFLPSGQGGDGSSGGNVSLPGYCPVGTYHPYPIGHPQQDLCVPFPNWATGGSTSSTSGGTGTTPRPRPRPGGGSTGALPPGYWLNPRTGRIEPHPLCPAGMVFDPNAGQCVRAGAGGLQDLFSGAGNSWLWLLLLLAGLLAVSSGSGDRDRQTTVTYKRR